MRTTSPGRRNPRPVIRSVLSEKIGAVAPSDAVTELTETGTKAAVASMTRRCTGNACLGVTSSSSRTTDAL